MVSPGPPSRPLAFLCHSSGDKERVRQLYWKLKRDGYDCWFDEEDLIPGQNWEREIYRALRRSDYIIVCLSQTSINKRGFVQKELKTALDIADELPEGEIFLIPVRLERCEPPDRLRPLHWVDLFTDTGYRQLTRALQPRGASNATVPASAWDRIVPPEPERQRTVPWQNYQTATKSVFLSYRREDAASWAGRIYDLLAAKLGEANVFMDVESIGLGIGLREVLERALAQVQSFVVIIGPDWLTAKDTHGGRRIDNPEDFVRMGIEVALRQSKSMVAVLIDPAEMPPATALPATLAPLARLNALRLSQAHFRQDASRLVRLLEDEFM